MPNISSLTMPDGIVYAIKDSQARKDIEDIKKNGSGSGGSGNGSSSEIKIAMDGENFILFETITMPELYNDVINGAQIYMVPTMPEQEGIIIHDYKVYFSVQMVSHVTNNGNERYTVIVTNKLHDLTLYLYNTAGSNEVEISEHTPAT